MLLELYLGQLSPPKLSVATKLYGSGIILAVSVPLRSMSSLWFATLPFALTSHSAVMRTRNQTAMSKLVEY